MNRTLFMIPILLSIAIPIAPAFAETVKYHLNGEIAFAYWANGSSYAAATVFEIRKPYALRMLEFTLQDTVSGTFILERKELTSAELKWNSGACELATEIAGFNLTVEWTAYESYPHIHTNEKIDIKYPTDVSIHYMSTITIKNAEITVNWNGSTMDGYGQLWQENTVSVAKFTEDPCPPPPPPPPPPFIASLAPSVADASL